MKRAFFVGVLLAGGAALGYVRSRTPGGVGTHWSSSCVFITPDSAATADVPAADVFGVVQKSMANWQNGLGGSAYLKLVYQQPQPLEAHLDGVNTVKFRSDRWCHPNDAQQHDVCYSSAAAAITTVFYVQDGNSKAGTILDADIELNDLNFTFALLPTTNSPRPGTTIADLENTLTHELGHVMGLDHTCTDSATPKQEVDNTGQKPPSCNMLYLLPLTEQQTIENATMYNFASPGETKKRTPKADDLAGIAEAYPPANDPNSCKPINLDDYKTGGCAFDAGAPAFGLTPLLFLAAALGARRRRRDCTPARRA